VRPRASTVSSRPRRICHSTASPRVFTLFGVLMLGVLGNGLTQMNVDSYAREMVTGSIIVIAVAAGSLGRAR
jgi:ribose/xylose/arabinose/galactoside ABC-type transport system permease subunit